MIRSSLSKQIAAAQTAIHNASEHQEIQKRLNQYGFSPKRMQEGQALFNQVVMLQDEKKDRYGEKQEIAMQLKGQFKETKKRFSNHVATVKLAFRDEPATLAKFKISRIAAKQSEWQSQASYFYSKATEYAKVLEGYQLPLSELTQNQASIEALIALRNRRIRMKGEAKEATHNRNLRIQALRAWLKEFYGIALQDSPQLMEVLGVTVKSGKVY